MLELKCFIEAAYYVLSRAGICSVVEGSLKISKMYINGIAKL
jgi:hypothetical protein